MSDLSSWENDLENPGVDGHFVQLYQEGDQFYTDAICLFSAAALRKEESIILVATSPHWHVLAGQLSDQGFNVASLRREGRLMLLDADETLPKFMNGKLPDTKVFKGLAQATIEKARAGSRSGRVRWWGEMVNVLYVNGNPTGSTRLEELFDEVAHEQRIPIFCSFCMDKFDPAIYSGDLQNVCRTHAGLMPAADYARYQQCVDLAVEDVLGSDPKGLLKGLRPAIGQPIPPQMPAAQALLLWLNEKDPKLTEDVLRRARELDRSSTKSPRRMPVSD